MMRDEVDGCLDRGMIEVEGGRHDTVAQKIASTDPAAPSRWPIADLVDDIATASEAEPSTRCKAASSISSPRGVDVPCAFT